ncbi:MAG: hypothetical protein ABWZ16_05535 [Microbacterium sp.]
MDRMQQRRRRAQDARSLGGADRAAVDHAIVVDPRLHFGGEVRGDYEATPCATP